MTSRRERILGVTQSLVSNFLYYDEDLESGAIEQAIGSKEISSEEIVQEFRITLEKSLPTTPEP